jgi:LacI family transcriptional regulator
MTSLADIARRAGVSSSTVSRVLAGSRHPVSAATQERVMAAVRELNFRPNLLARGLATSRTHVLGAIVHDISDPYFGAIVRGLEQGARAGNYHLFVCGSDRDAVRELAEVEALMSRRVDALIFTGGGIDDPSYQSRLRRVLSDYRAQGGVVVQLAPAGVPGRRIEPDNHGGTEMVVRHLAELGHRRIGYVAGPAQIRTSAIRLDGYLAGLKATRLRADDGLIVSGDFSVASGAKATAELLATRPDVTAIVAANDITAFGVLDELDRRGIRVPADISVAGFDDIEAASLVRPRLTTARIPITELGRAGAEMAQALLAGKRPRSVVLPSELVVRDSTGRPPRRR